MRMNEKEKNDLFIKACEKAGLKVMENAGSHVARGLIVRDAQGRKYTVDSDGQLITDENVSKKYPRRGNGQFVTAGIKVYDNQGRVFVFDSNKRRRFVGNMENRTSSQKHSIVVARHGTKRVAGKRGIARLKG